MKPIWKTRSPAMLRLLSDAEKFYRSDLSVLILGESGVGKECLADFIQEKSPLRNKPYLKINCAAFPETMIDSELFGHERGAFTGAFNRRVGKFEAADGGTIFIDEIADISEPMQCRLLRVIDNNAFERLGGNNSIKADVRIISATNKKIGKYLDKGWMRRDFFYRLGGAILQIPPLRSRQEDIIELAGSFLDEINHEKRFTPMAETKLLQYNWPGNLRELYHAVQLAALQAEGEAIEAPHVSCGGNFNALSVADGGMAKLNSLNLLEVEKSFVIEAPRRLETK